MSELFSVVVCDPCYSFSDKLNMSDVKRSAEANYNTMSNEELLKLPVKDILDPSGAILALWVPSSLLPLGLDLMKAYGCELKQTYIWVKSKKDIFLDIKRSFFKLIKNFIKNKGSLKELQKDFNEIKFEVNGILSFGMGRLFRQCHEVCLIGINDTKIYKKLKNKSQRSLSIAYNERHSKKPENLQDSLELMFPNEKYCELFARRIRKNWLCLGNEINGKDIRDELNELIK